MTGPARELQRISLEDVDQLLGQVMDVRRGWAALVLFAAILSAVSLTFKGGALEATVQVTAITAVLIGLVWLPAIVRVIALAGGGVKTPAGEATSGGLLDLLRSLEPAGQRGAVTAVIAALDTDPRRNDPELARVRSQLQGELAGVPVASSEARDRLTALAREYESVRKTMLPGPGRTFRMSQIVTEARGLAKSAGLDPRTLTGLFLGPGDGDRVVTLAAIQATPDPAHLPIVEDAIRNARSPFEQYTALDAGIDLVPVLPEAGRAILRAAVSDRMNPGAKGVVVDERDPDRLQKAHRLVTALEQSSD